MSTLKKMTCLGLTVVAALFLLYAPSVSAKSIHIKLAHDNAVNQPGHKAFLDFKRIVEEESEGRITVTIFPGGQMGSVADTFQQVRKGDLEMSVTATTLLTQTIPEFAIWDLFYLFDNAEHAHKVLDGKAGQELMKPLERFKMKGLGYMEIGFRNFSNSKRPIEKATDVAGLKIRGYSPMQISAWSAAGVNLTTLSWTEVFTSLQQNLIDGQECATSSFYDARFYEAQPYWSLTGHIYTNWLWYVNQNFWENTLSDEDRALVEKAVKEAIRLDRQYSAEAEQAALKSLEEAGIAINELPLEEKHALGEMLNSAVKDDIIEKAGQDIYDLVMKEIEAARQ